MPQNVSAAATYLDCLAADEASTNSAASFKFEKAEKEVIDEVRVCCCHGPYQ